ncbi:MAG: protein-export chaperone SecB [Magnetococcales bacterium]|nr:protein-export chaperone SecB [Magnetococcales bacterium]
MAKEPQLPTPPPPAPPGGSGNAADQPLFHVEKVYLKDFSFENPNTPEVFQVTKEPKVEFNLETGSTRKGEHHYEVTLHVTTEVKLEERTMFLVDVTYAGLFLVRNVPEQHVPLLLGVDCPGILFPYLRQVVSSTITEGGFKPLVLDPINFAALYQQQARTRQPQQDQGATRGPSGEPVQ